MSGAAIVWVTDRAWAAVVEAARAWVPADAEVVLLHVVDDEAADVAHGAFLGLLGRGRTPHDDPARGLSDLSAAAAGNVLEAAATRLGRPATPVRRHGRTGHEVVLAAEGAAVLICARDGDQGRLGPHSLGPGVRFVVDHAPCPVLLVWPEGAPGVGGLPPPPPGP